MKQKKSKTGLIYLTIATFSFYIAGLKFIEFVNEKKENLKVVSSEFDQALKKSLIKTKNKINSLAKIISEKTQTLLIDLMSLKEFFQVTLNLER